MILIIKRIKNDYVVFQNNLIIKTKYYMNMKMILSITTSRATRIFSPGELWRGHPSCEENPPSHSLKK